MESERKQFIRQTFNTVAEAYENPYTAYFPNTAQRMVELLAPPENASLLDVCTGTGLVARQASKHLTQGLVTGVDLSPRMLDQARQHAHRENLNNIEFQVMDMESLDFPDQHFDIITCSFGLFFVDDMGNALNHLRSKLKPGGQLAISSFSAAAFSPAAPLFAEHMQAFGQDLGTPGWMDIGEPSSFKALVQAAGFPQVDIHPVPQTLSLSAAEQWWELIWSTGYRGMLENMPGEDLTAFKNQHLNEIEKLCTPNPLSIDTSTLIAIGKLS